MDVLVLSDQWVPMRRIEWQSAISDVVSGRATVVEEYEDRFIHTATQVWPMPSVIRFVRKVAGMFRRGRGVKFSRQNVWLRDKGRCAYCGGKVRRSDFTYDHVVPKTKHGDTSWENIVVSCFPCNQRKANRTPEKAGMRLLIKPIRPKTLPGSSVPAMLWEVGMPLSWKDYLGSIEYWHGQLDPD